MYKLDKPYTEKQRLDFIVTYNHNQGLKIEETDLALFALEVNEIMSDGEPVIDPEYEQKQQQKEQERVDNLTMTAQDFLFTCMKDILQVPMEVLDQFLNNNVELKLRLTTCQSVWCKAVKSMCPLVIGDFELTTAMVEYLFKFVNGEVTQEELMNVFKPVEVEEEVEENNVDET